MSNSKHARHRIPPPRSKAILLCNHVLVDSSTHSNSLIGLIRVIRDLQLPGHTPEMVLFLQMVNGFGKYDISLAVEDLSHGLTIARGKGPRVFFPDPLAVREISLRLKSIPIKRPGRYDVVVFGNEQEIDRQQFQIMAPDIPKGGEQ